MRTPRGLRVPTGQPIRRAVEVESGNTNTARDNAMSNAFDEFNSHLKAESRDLRNRVADLLADPDEATPEMTLGVLLDMARVLERLADLARGEEFEQFMQSVAGARFRNHAGDC